MRKLLLLSAAALVVAAAPAPVASAAVACPHADELPGRLTVSEVKVATLCLINAERRERGLAPLHQNGRLTIAGTRHARDMVTARYFSHDSRNGAAFDTR